MSHRIVHSVGVCFAVMIGSVSAQAQVVHVSGSIDARLSGYCQSIAEMRSGAGSIGDFRVKRGGHVTVTGVRQTIYIEEGGAADLRGTGSLVYVAKGGKATVAGERNVVYAERGGNVVTIGKVTMSMVDTIQLQLHQGGTSCR